MLYLSVLIFITISTLLILFITYHIITPMVLLVLTYFSSSKVSSKFSLSTLLVLNSYWSLSFMTLSQLTIHLYTLKINFLINLYSINTLFIYLMKLYL